MIPIIRKSPEWWAKLPPCPLKVWRERKCPGKIIKLKNKLTNQTLYSCTECCSIFVGDSIPTENTPCCYINRYSNMLCVDESSWELTEEEVQKKWDVEYYFKHVYNPHNDLPTPKKIQDDNGVEICPCCRDLKKITSGIDERGHRYRIKELNTNKLQLLHIPQTGQRIQYCRFCGSIWSERREPEISRYGGILEMYLALLGIIQFCET
jgi:hypothetical protein